MKQGHKQGSAHGPQENGSHRAGVEKPCLRSFLKSTSKRNNATAQQKSEISGLMVVLKNNGT